MLGEQLHKFFESDNTEELGDHLKLIIEKIEKAISDLRQENSNLKERLQEILKQLDIYQKEVVGSKELERLKLIQAEEILKREIDLLKREKEKLVDRSSELALALKEATEDFKLQKDENERLRERLCIYEKNHCAPTRGNSHVPPLKLISDVTNRSTNATGDRARATEHRALKEYCEMVSDYRMGENSVKYSSKNSCHYRPQKEQGKLARHNFDSNTSYFTDEDDNDAINKL